MLLPETLPAERRKDPGLGALRVVMDGLFATYKRLLADPRQVALLVMKCAFLCGLSLILTVVPLHATATWGASATDLGKVLCIGWSMRHSMRAAFEPRAASCAGVWPPC